MMMETISSSETSIITRATQRNIPEDAILRGQSRENLKSNIPASNVCSFVQEYCSAVRNRQLRQWTEEGGCLFDGLGFVDACRVCVWVT
jgi:hypothetical protein